MVADHTGRDTAPRTVGTALGEVCVAQFGPEDGAPVLICHGSPGGYDVAVAMGRFLARAGFRVIAPSRPGYPGTPLSEATETPDGQADLMVALLDALGVDKVGVLAWSGGGPCAYRMAANYGSRVSALVAVAALSGAYDWHLSWSERFFMRTRAGAVVVRLLADFLPEQLITATLAAEGSLRSAEIQARSAEIAADPERRALVLEAARSAVDSGDRARGLANDTHQFAVLGLLNLPRILVPTLVVHGDADSDVDPEYGERACAEINDAVALKMERGTHLCLWVDPGYEDAQAAVVEFLAARAGS